MTSQGGMMHSPLVWSESGARDGSRVRRHREMPVPCAPLAVVESGGNGFAPTSIVGAVGGGLEAQGFEFPAAGGTRVGFLVKTQDPAGRAVGHIGGDDGVPVSAGVVAVDLDQWVGHIMDDKGHDLEVAKQLAYLFPALGVTGVGAAVPDAVLGKQLRHLIGETVGGAFPATVVVVHVGRLQLDDGFAVLHDLEASF